MIDARTNMLNGF